MYLVGCGASISLAKQHLQKLDKYILHHKFLLHGLPFDCICTRQAFSKLIATLAQMNPCVNNKISGFASIEWNDTLYIFLGTAEAL